MEWILVWISLCDTKWKISEEQPIYIFELISWEGLFLPTNNGWLVRRVQREGKVKWRHPTGLIVLVGMGQGSWAPQVRLTWVLCLCGLNLEKGEATYVVQIVWSLFIKIVIWLDHLYVELKSCRCLIFYLQKWNLLVICHLHCSERGGYMVWLETEPKALLPWKLKWKTNLRLYSH